MTKLLPVMGIALLLAVLPHLLFPRMHQWRIRQQLSKNCFIGICVVLVLFVGLRTRYNDTTMYTHSYEMLAQQENYFGDINWKIGSNPGFNFTNAVLVYIGVPTQSFLMFYAAITIVIYLWFMYKYSDNLPFSLFLLFTLGCFTFTLAAIKQCMAMALCLIATDRAIQRKNLSFIIWVLIAATYHPYALLYFIVPFLMFRPWSGKSIIILSIFAIVGLLLQRLLGTLVSITSMIGEEYTIESFTGDGVNPFRLAVCAVPLILALIARNVIYVKNDRVNNLFVNLSMLNAEIMFVALFGTANYFARLANYFLIFQTISLPWLLSHFDSNSRKVMNLGAVAGYSAYFYYANVINQNFDSLYYSISLIDYLKAVF